MATSGTRTFTLDVADIMEDAYERLGRTLHTAYDARKGRRSLNLLFQEWSNRGVNLWTVQQSTLPLTSGTSDYTLNDYDLDIVDAVVRENGTDYVLERITRADYLALPNKSTTGRPTQLYVERTDPVTIKLWPTPSSGYSLISYRIQRIQDASTSQNNVDVPSRFIPALVSGLAYYLSISMAPDRTMMMKQLYEEDFQRAADEDSERGSWFIRPSVR